MTPTPRSADALASPPPFSLFSRLTSLLQGARPLDESLCRLLEGVAQGMRAERAELLLLEGPEGKLTGRCSTGKAEEAAPGSAGGRFPLEAVAGMVSAALEKGEPQVLAAGQHCLAVIPLVAW